MFCPKCRTEYRPGFDQCPDCDIPLISVLPDQKEDWQSDLTTVFTTFNPAIVIVAKSLLEAAGIRYFQKNEGLQSFLGVTPFGGNINPIGRPMRCRC